MAASLSDQLGAMAIIDGLRHRRMLVDELLDLPRRREEAAQRIREYYAAQNVDVDEALIEQGVSAYFDRRLEFEPAERGKWESRAAAAYIRSQRGAAAQD